jgi:hypothetical protein
VQPVATVAISNEPVATVADTSFKVADTSFKVAIVAISNEPVIVASLEVAEEAIIK